MAKMATKFYLQGNKYTAERLAILTEMTPETVKKTIDSAERKENEPVDDLFEITGRRDYIFQIFRFRGDLTYLSKIALKSDLYAFDLWTAIQNADKQSLDSVDSVVLKMQQEKSVKTSKPQKPTTNIKAIQEAVSALATNELKEEPVAPTTPIVQYREPVTITLPPKWIEWLREQDLSKGLVIERLLEKHVAA